LEEDVVTCTSIPEKIDQNQGHERKERGTKAGSSRETGSCGSKVRLGLVWWLVIIESNGCGLSLAEADRFNPILDVEGNVQLEFLQKTGWEEKSDGCLYFNEEKEEGRRRKEVRGGGRRLTTPPPHLQFLFLFIFLSRSPFSLPFCIHCFNFFSS
jgi:hypothetical protein